MFAHACLLGLAVLALHSQDPQVEPAADPAADPAVLLDELIARTNTLDGFRARYRLRKSEELEVRFDIAFSAPDRMRLVIEQVEGEGTMLASTWVVGAGLYVRVLSAEGARVVGDLDFEDLPDPAGAVLRVLDECFPLEIDGLGPGPEVALTWGVDDETDKAEVELRILYQIQKRGAVLGWLEHLRQVEGEWTVGDHSLEWRRPDGRIAARVSRDTGFLEYLRLVGADGTPGELELVELDLAPNLEPTLFDVPPRTEGAEDMFSDPIRAVLGGLDGIRRLAYWRVDESLSKGRREWTPGLRQEWELVVEALHENPLARMHDGMHGPVEERTQEMAAHVRERLTQGPPDGESLRAQLRDEIRQWRDGLVRSIDQEQQRYLKGISAPGRREGGSDHLADLHALEREQVVALFVEVVREPLLAMFDERLREALEG